MCPSGLNTKLWTKKGQVFNTKQLPYCLHTLRHSLLSPSSPWKLTGELHNMSALCCHRVNFKLELTDTVLLDGNVAKAIPLQYWN